MYSDSYSGCVVPSQKEGKMASRMRSVCQGRLGPPRHQCHSACSWRNTALTSAPTEFRQLTGCPVAEAIDCHPMSDYSTLSSSKSPYRLELGVYLSFRGESLEDVCQSKTKLTSKGPRKFWKSEIQHCTDMTSTISSESQDTNIGVSVNT